MKRVYIIFTLIFSFTACKLNIEPETSFTDNNFWTSEANLRSFSFALYDVFKGYGNGGFFGGDHFYSTLNDDVVTLDDRTEFDFPNTVPATTAGTDWTWYDIRQANVLIEGAKKATVAESVKQKYIGVGRLFRAILYWEKVREFGDVPFYNKPLDDTDTDELYKPRDSQVLVVDSIVADLDYAIAHLDEIDNKTEVNKWTALALKSRICLAAASTFKYHNVPGSDPTALYQAAYDAAKELMNNGPFALSDDYSELFASEDLTGNPEVILVKIYNENMRHAIHSFIFHEPFFGFTLSAVSSFLMADGKPISYDGNPHPNYTEWVFSTTDTITTSLTSYKIPVNIANGRDKRMKAIIDTTRLIFPFNKGIPMYSPAKYVNYDIIANPPTQGVQATTDAPIIRLGEVYLNYAEAAFELGILTQADLDNSINLLRQRAGVAPLSMSVGFNADDRDPNVDPLLWEIRRERRVELMLEPFRKWDLLRWKNGPYYDDDKAFVGVKPDPNLVFEDGINVMLNNDGYIYFQAPEDRRKPWDDKKYLYPIPADQLTLNPNLTQNPGW